MNIYQTEEYRGFNINIYIDEEPIEPREEDPLCSMICFHSRYNLGDKHDFSNPEDFQEWLSENKYIEGKNIFILPLYLYDHSGLTMNTGGFSCQWDSGQVGWIYLTAERFKNECARPVKPYKDGINPTLQQIKHISKKDKVRIYRMLKNEVEEYDQYLTGQVYGYQIEPTDRNKSIECDDSCWGFYGDEGIKEIINEAKNAINYAIKEYKNQIIKDKKERVKFDKFYNSSFAL